MMFWAGNRHVSKRKCERGSQTICLQAIPARMSCDDVLERVGEEVFKEYNNCAHGSPRSVHQAGGCLTGKLSWTRREQKAARVSTMMKTRMNQLRLPSVPSWPRTCTREATWEARSPFSRSEEDGDVGAPPS